MKATPGLKILSSSFKWLRSWHSDNHSLLGLAIVTSLMAVDLVVLLCCCVAARDSPGALGLNLERSEGNPDVTHLTPVLTPRVTHNPVALVGFLVLSPTNNRNDMVNASASIRDNALLEVEEWHSIDSTGNWASVVDFLHHGILAGDGAIVRNGDVRVAAEASAATTFLVKAATSSGNVQRIAGEVGVRAEAFLGLRGAGEVWVGSLVAHTSACLLRDLMDPLVCTVNGSSMARANTSTVEDMLDGKVDIDALGPTGNLDTISKGGDCSMSPARATVLRNVLVTAHCAIALAILVAPGELSWVRLWCTQHDVRRVLRAVSTPHNSQLDCLFHAEDLAFAHVGSGACNHESGNDALHVRDRS